MPDLPFEWSCREVRKLGCYQRFHKFSDLYIFDKFEFGKWRKYCFQKRSNRKIGARIQIIHFDLDLNIIHGFVHQPHLRFIAVNSATCSNSLQDFLRSLHLECSTPHGSKAIHLLAIHPVIVGSVAYHNWSCHPIRLGFVGAVWL